MWGSRIVFHREDEQPAERPDLVAVRVFASLLPRQKRALFVLKSSTRLSEHPFFGSRVVSHQVDEPSTQQLAVPSVVVCRASAPRRGHLAPLCCGSFSAPPRHERARGG